MPGAARQEGRLGRPRRLSEGALVIGTRRCWTENPPRIPTRAGWVITAQRPVEPFLLPSGHEPAPTEQARQQRRTGWGEAASRSPAEASLQTFNVRERWFDGRRTLWAGCLVARRVHRRPPRSLPARRR